MISPKVRFSMLDEVSIPSYVTMTHTVRVFTPVAARRGAALAFSEGALFHA